MLNKVARYVLTAASIAPVFVTLALLSAVQEKWCPFTIYTILASVSVMMCICTLWAVKNYTSRTTKNLESVSPADKEVTNYFLTYLFPLICGPSTFTEGWKIPLIFIGSLFFYIKFSSSYSVNPIISFFRYRFYEAEDDTGVKFILLTRGEIINAKNITINVKKVSDHIYLKTN